MIILESWVFAKTFLVTLHVLLSSGTGKEAITNSVLITLTLNKQQIQVSCTSLKQALPSATIQQQILILLPLNMSPEKKFKTYPQMTPSKVMKYVLMIYKVYLFLNTFTCLYARLKEEL